MKRLVSPTLAGLLLCAGLSAQTPMSGTYGIPANFPTFSAAATALQTKGVKGPVTINVVPGTYTESFTLGHVAGMT